MYLFFQSLWKADFSTMLNQEYLCSNDAGVKRYKGRHRVESVLHYWQTTNILPIHVLVLSLHIIWYDLLFVFKYDNLSAT